MIDIKKWLMEDLGFTAEECTDAFIAQMSPKADRIEKGFLRQSDYSKHMNDLKTKSDALTTEIAEWHEVQSTTQAEAVQRREAIEALEKEKLVLNQAVVRLAEQAGVKVEDVLKGVVTPPKEPEPVKPFDPNPINQAISNVAGYMLTLATDLPVIMAEHRRLTGEDLDPRQLRVEIERRAKAKEPTDPTQVWEAMFGIADKREAKRVLDHATEIKAAEDRGREAARSEAAIPGAQTTGSHAPIFGGERKSVLQRPQPGRNTSGFASSLATGKYRRPMPGPGAGTR